MNEIELILKLFLALVFGGLIGMERRSMGRAAGFRTQMLVCMGSAMFTMMSYFGIANAINVDPTRIAASIVVGIGFLGAGSIIQSKGEIVGLTTAASTWLTAAVGMAVGFGYYALAGTATVLALVVLHLLIKLEDKD